MSLKAQAFEGIRWTSVSSLGRAILQFAQIIVLSRLLGPADFGQVALVTATVAFLQIFADAGISNAIIHRRDISAEQLSSLYWFNIGASGILSALLLLCSPLITAWYGQPELAPLFFIAAAALLVNAIGQQLKIQAQKNLLFQALAKVELFGATCGFIIAILLAWQGAGSRAMVAGTLATSAAGTLAAWLTLANGWRPQIRLKYGEITEFVHFGLYMIGNNLANTINSQIDIFLGAKLLGATSTGLYSVPKELNLRIAGLINPIITQVAFPVMAKAQDDVALLRTIYLQIMRMTSSVNFPIYVFMGIFANDIVHVILGPIWQDATPLLQILSAWALLRSTVNPIGSLLMARGRIDLSFKWNLAMLLVIPVAILIGSRAGVTGMAAAMTAVLLLTYWPNWRYQVRPLCGAGFLEYSWQMLVPLLNSLAAAAIAKTITYAVQHDILRCLLEAISFASFYSLLSVIYNKPFFTNIRTLLQRKS